MPDEIDALTADEQALLDADRDNAAVPPEPAPQPIEAGDVEGGEADAGEASPATEKPAAKQPTMVPHQALHEERRLRQEAERQRDEDRKRASLLEERMNLILRQLPQEQQQKAPDAELPDWAEKPLERIAAEFQRRDQVMQAVVQAVAAQNQQSEQSRAMGSLAARADELERQFAAQTPDYEPAYKHLIENRRQELGAAGWSDPAEIKAFMAQEAAALAQAAIQRGKNPAEVIYELAKIRGYRSPGASNGAAGDGQVAAAAEQIQTIARGQQQAAGINRVPGQSPAQISAAAIAAMPEEEFSAWLSKASTADKRRLGLA